jgi:hypothetical protein
MTAPPSRKTSPPVSERRHTPDAGFGMDGLRSFLDALRDHNLIAGRFLGVLHVAIGRRVSKTDGTLLSTGATWRELAALLKAARFDREWVREFGADPDVISPRDRERFWYTAIGLAHVDSAAAVAQAEKLIPLVKPLGFVIGPSPVNAIPSPPAAPKEKPAAKAAKPPADKKKKAK